MQSSQEFKARRGLLAAIRAGCVLLVLVGSTAVSSAAGLDSRAGAPASPLGKSTLGDYVWLDKNGDGQHVGTAEAEYVAGINGVLVNLYLDINKNGVIDDGEYVSNMLTGDDPGTPGVVETGWYDFAVNGNLQYIVEIAPSNYLPGGPLAGYVLTSKNTFGGGSDPLVAFLNGSPVDYSDADFGFARMDLGDLPSSYPTLIANNGARHLIISPLVLGSIVDPEPDGQPSVTATGDDLNPAQMPDDEDGVTMLPGVSNAGYWTDGAVTTGHGGSLQIVIGGASGVPQLFMDFSATNSGLQPVILRNASGGALPTSAWAPGAYQVYFDIPLGTMITGPIIETRVRLSRSGGLAATGQAPDGEVEDYVFAFGPTAVSVSRFAAAPLASASEAAGPGAAVLLSLLLAALAGWGFRAKRAARG